MALRGANTSIVYWDIVLLPWPVLFFCEKSCFMQKNSTAFSSIDKKMSNTILQQGVFENVRVKNVFVVSFHLTRSVYSRPNFQATGS